MSIKVEDTLQRELDATDSVVVIRDKWRGNHEECIQVIEVEPDETQIIEDDALQMRWIDGPEGFDEYARLIEYEELD